MKVLIAGAGIAGPTAAIALRKAGISPIICEALPEDGTDAGAFVTIAANGQDALHAIDARKPVSDASFPAARLRIFNSDGTQTADFPLGHGHPGPRTITRALLSRTLRQEAARRQIRTEYGKRLTSAIAYGTGARAFFADGSHADADLIIGADGIRSPLRTAIEPAAPAPRYTGLMIACGYSDTPSTPTACYDMIHGSQAFFGHTSGPDGRDWWFARVPAPEPAAGPAMSASQSRDFLIAAFEADATPAADIIRATAGPITITSAYDIPSLPAWHNNTMIVIGDAAHAASPSTAQGASMALEDAVILAQCLRDIPAIPAALTAFEQTRRHRVERIVQAGVDSANPPAPAPDRPRPGGPPGWLYNHHIEWDNPIHASEDVLTASADS